MKVAQAQAQRNTTFTDSLNTVCAMVKMSVYHTAHLRGLLDGDVFKETPMNQLENGLTVNLLTLEKANPEARALMAWVEEGVLDAVKRGYLETCTFGFSADKDAKQLLEQYVYTFKYDPEGEVTMELGSAGKPGSKAFNTADKKGANINNLRYQATRLMRALITMCSTLEKVPAERHLFMKLTYRPQTPEEYEPPSFVPAGGRAIGYFSRRPFSMEAGQVETGYHTVALRVKTVLDNNADVGDVEPVPDYASDSNTQCDTEDDDDEPSVMGARQEEDPYNQKYQADLAELFTEQPEEGSAAHPSQHLSQATATPNPDQLNSVRSWVLRRKHEVSLLDAMSHFSEMAISVLESCFRSLVEGGTLVTLAEKDLFRVVAAGAAATQQQQQQPTQQQQARGLDVERHMQGLALGTQTDERDGSLIGGVHAVPGSQCTESMAPAGGPRHGAYVESGNQGLPWMDSQQSDPMRAARKTSIVEALIHQKAKRQRREEPAAAPAPKPAPPGGPCTRTRRAKSNLCK